MHRLSAFILAVIICSTSALSQCVDSLFIQDLDTLKHWVEALHPDAFARSTKELWNEAYEVAINSECTSELDQLVVISEFLKTLKDSHTSLSLGTWGRKVSNTYGEPEISFIIKGGKLFSKEGIQFVEVNGIRDTTLIKTARSLTMLEGDNYHAENLISGEIVAHLALTMWNCEPEGVFKGITLVDGNEQEITLRTQFSKRKISTSQLTGFIQTTKKLRLSFKSIRLIVADPENFTEISAKDLES